MHRYTVQLRTPGGGKSAVYFTIQDDIGGVLTEAFRFAEEKGATVIIIYAGHTARSAFPLTKPLLTESYTPSNPRARSGRNARSNTTPISTQGRKSASIV